MEERNNTNNYNITYIIYIIYYHTYLTYIFKVCTKQCTRQLLTTLKPMPN